APAPAAPVGGCAGGGCPMMIPPPGGTTTVVRKDGAPAAAAVSGHAWSWETLPWWVWLLVGLVLVALGTRSWPSPLSGGPAARGYAIGPHCGSRWSARPRRCSCQGTAARKRRRLATAWWSSYPSPAPAWWRLRSPRVPTRRRSRWIFAARRRAPTWPPARSP